MKKIFSVFSALFLFGAVTALSAKDKSSDEKSRLAIIKSGTIVKVFYKSEEPSQARVSIVNESGRVFFSESLRSDNGFVRPYNLRSLPAGKYFVKVSDNQGVQTQQFTIESSKSVAYVVLPIKGNNNQYSLLIPGDAGRVKIDIYDNDELIYTKTEEVPAEGLGNIYTFPEAKGKIGFVVSSGK